MSTRQRWGFWVWFVLEAIVAIGFATAGRWVLFAVFAAGLPVLAIWHESSVRKTRGRERDHQI
jgi:hypothetical protein